MSSLWRPAPYAYLDDTTASSGRAVHLTTMPPPATAFHVTPAAASDQAVAMHEEAAGPSTSYTHVHHDSARQRQSHQNWSQHSQLGPDGQQHQLPQEHQHSQALEQDHVPRQQSSRTSRWRWQWFRGLRAPQIGSRQHDSGSRQLRPSFDQRELLHRVRDVLPHLSDEAILAELGNTDSVDEAVDNLLTG